MTISEFKDNLALVFIFFWTTILGIRFFIADSLEEAGRSPEIVVSGLHIHHFIIGFVLLAMAIFLHLLARNKGGFLKLVAIGVGLGLVFDEFVYWRYLDFNYWAVSNFLAVTLTAAFFIVLYHLPIKRIWPISEVSPIHKNPASPFISVVIPALNEEKFLPLSLESLIKQDYSNFELIVVDNNSSDKTAKIAEKFGAKVLFEPNPGVAFARQKGFMEAKGEIIATTDADTILPSNWISQIIKEFKERPKLAMFGGLYHLFSGPLMARLGVKYFVYWMFFLDKISHPDKSWPLPGANMAIRKEIFQKVGGFKVELKLGEDVDLSRRAAQFGEVVLDRHFMVQTSGRRFRHGLLSGLLTYAPNGLGRMFLKKDMFVRLPTVRHERSFLKNLVLVPLLVSGVFLFSLFYNFNPSVSQAKELKGLKAKVIAVHGKVKKEERVFKESWRRRP